MRYRWLLGVPNDNRNALTSEVVLLVVFVSNILGMRRG